jgi:feruloyl esterase
VHARQPDLEGESTLRILLLGAVAAALAMLTLAVNSAPAATTARSAAACAELAARAPADVRITRSAIEQPGTAWAGGGPEAARQPPTPVKAPFCRVQGVIEQEIGFELWLPLTPAWNGKFLGAGVGGDAGAFNLRDLPRGVNRGYAAATTDTGHKAGDATWMLGRPDRLQNFTHRSNHLLALKGKQLVAAFYGAPARRAYFIGCSGGGRQGLKEIQLYPADYDGVISGANGPRTPEMTVRRMWELIQRDGHPGLMSPADWKLISDAAIRTCDDLDGVKDGVLEDPRRCRFDVAAIQCGGAKASDCLTTDQVAFARQIYAPLRDEGGRAIDQGLLPGVLIDSGRSQLAPRTFGQAVRGVREWNGEGFSVGADLAAIDRVMPQLRADDPHLDAFRRRGGKVIFYTGWMDPAVAARMVTEYYDKVVAAAGGERQASTFTRLYMLPGVFHCAGGPGPDQAGGSGQDAPVVDPQHDMLSALEAWVEGGVAPQTLIAAKLAEGRVVRTRPLCTYPRQAHYRGAGSTDEAANFRCVRPAAH